MAFALTPASLPCAGEGVLTGKLPEWWLDQS
jgi:hypothetical protein